MKNLTYSISKLSQTVFTTREIALILGETNSDIVKSKINYYVKRGELFSLRRGIYSKDPKFNGFELATKLYTPSYVSFETILAKHNVVFQYDSRIHLACYVTREIEINKIKIYYKKMTSNVLHDPNGISNEKGYPEATVERAFLDTIYLFGKRHFDNLEPIDIERCKNMLSIYEGAITKEDLKSYVNNN